jgi:ribosome-associated heat shock protein Hsp15
MTDATASPGRLRLDKWLWYTRFVKTRTLAQTLCASGHVKLNGASVAKASTTVKPGDELELVTGPVRRYIRIVALGDRRGPAPEAQALYEQVREPERLTGFRSEVRPRGEGRPTKKDRRDIDRLKGTE